MSASETLAKQQDDTAAGFHQSWFPLALASELGRDQVMGRDFLGTRVILYRDEAGKALVQSAYCPHLGADLSVGQVVSGQIRCAYHHWRFDCSGRCVDIPTETRSRRGPGSRPIQARRRGGSSGRSMGKPLGSRCRAFPGPKSASWSTRRISAERAPLIPGWECQTASISSTSARSTVCPRWTRTR